MKNTDIIITKYALIKQKKAKITCLCDFCHFKNLCFMFYRCFQTLENNKSPQPLQPWAFISFLVCGNPGKTLALVFEILRKICCLVKFAWLSSLSIHFPTLIYFNINNDITFIVTMKYTQHTCISCCNKFVYYMYHENFTS